MPEQTRHSDEITCQKLKYYFRRNRGMVISLNKDLFSHFSQGEIIRNTNGRRMRRLKDLMEEDKFSLSQVTPEFSFKQRRSLAAKLAFHLTVFADCKHRSRPWDREEIFFQGSSEEVYDKEGPYVPFLIHQELSSQPEEKAPRQLQQLEHLTGDAEGSPSMVFTKLAKVLLELEYGQLPKGNSYQDRDHGYTLIQEFHESHEGDDPSRQSYLDAVRACLEFDARYRRARKLGLARLGQEDEMSRYHPEFDTEGHIGEDSHRSARTPRPSREASQAQSIYNRR